MGGSADDPNEAILADMTDSERNAWRQALSGWPGDSWPNGPFPDWDAMGEEELAFNMNCSSRGMNQALAERDFANHDEFAPLLEAIDEFQGDLKLEITEADQAWSTCMADNGFPGIERQRQSQQQLSDEWVETWNEITGRPDWVGNPTLANSPELVNLRERELDQALADLDCRVATDFKARHQAQINAWETQFVNDHQASLNALRDAAAQFGN